MKAHTQTFKENLITLGKEINAKITYTIDNVETELDGDTLSSVIPHYEGDILKSVMKQVDIISDVDIPLNTEINVQFGMRYNTETYEYINYGNYIVFSSEKQEDTNNYKIIAYDKMLYAMKEYEELEITYPITIRDYINAICTEIGLQFANSSDTFANYDQTIQSELYDFSYTYRDILDELAQVTASTICINEDDELEVRYINNTYTNEFEIIGNTTQDGTPTPTNPIPIINKTGIIEEEINGVIRTLNIKDIWLGAINDYKDKIFKGKGINLFGFNETAIDKTSTYRTQSTQRLIITGTDNLNEVKFNYNNGPYSRGYFEIDGIDGTLTYQITFNVKENTTSYTPVVYIDTTNSTTQKLVFYINGNNGSTNVANTQYFILSNIQVTQSSNALPYEPYNAKDKWLLHKEIGEVVLNGSENWLFNNSYTYNVFYISIDTLKKELNVITTMSNYYKGVKNVGLADFGNTYNNSVAVRGYNDAYYHLYISNDAINSVADFKTWLSTHNTEVYYVLANPTTEEITNEELIKSLNNTGLDIINEDYIKNVRASFGKKYGPINSIVLSRSAESDNIYLQDEDSIEENGLCEIKIKDNQIMNDDTRDRFLPDILEQLDGLEYYINDFESIGITYLDLCDKYNVKIDDKTYTCIMFNDEVNIHDGLNEVIYAEEPKQSVTDYTKADKTDQRIIKTTLEVDKQANRITALVGETEDSFAQVQIDIGRISSEVQSTNIELDELGNEIDVVRSSITEQTSTAITDWFDSNLKSQLEDLQNSTDSNSESLNNIKSYIRRGIITDQQSPYYNQAYVEIGDDTNQTTLRILPSRIQFLTNGQETAYISNNQLYINESTILTKEKVGHWVTTEDENGLLNTYWED